MGKISDYISYVLDKFLMFAFLILSIGALQAMEEAEAHIHLVQTALLGLAYMSLAQMINRRDPSDDIPEKTKNFLFLMVIAFAIILALLVFKDAPKEVVELLRT